MPLPGYVEAVSVFIGNGVAILDKAQLGIALREQAAYHGRPLHAFRAVPLQVEYYVIEVYNHCISIIAEEIGLYYNTGAQTGAELLVI